MRLVEFAPDIIEDEAESRGDADLLTTLSYLQSQSQGKHLVPRVRVDSLVNMINMHQDDGAVPYTAKSLEDAYKTNSKVKNFIANIKEDEKTGTKYVYLVTNNPEDNMDAGETGSPNASGPEKIVSKMASKAAANRS